MIFDKIHLIAPGVARRVYDVTEGQVELPMPDGKDVPAATAKVAWDADTRTLTCTLDDDSVRVIVLTPEDVAAPSA